MTRVVALLLICLAATLATTTPVDSMTTTVTGFGTGKVFVGPTPVGAVAVGVASSGAGQLAVNVGHLSYKKPVRIAVYAGSCAHLGSSLVDVMTTTPTSTAINMVVFLQPGQMRPITHALRAGPVAIVIGSIKRCGTLSLTAKCATSVSRPAAPWKILVLIYPSAAFTYTGASGVPQSFQSRMTDTEMAELQSAAESVPATIAAWSHGYTGAEVTVSIASHPLTKVDAVPGHPGQIYVTASDVRADLDALAPAGRFDSVYLVWKPWNDGQNLNMYYAGLAEGVDGWTGAEVATGLLLQQSVIASWNADVLIHEWLHGVVFYYAGEAGYTGPNPDQGFGYSNSDNFHTYYSDLMTGNVHAPDGSSSGGITQTIWESGIPTTRAVLCAGLMPFVSTPLPV